MSQIRHFYGVKFKAWKSGGVKFWTNKAKAGLRPARPRLDRQANISATSFCIFGTYSTYTEAPSDLLWSKNVTWQTRGPNWPPLIQKRDVTDAGPKLTSFDPKTLRDRHRAPTALLWSKNVTWQTRGPNWPSLIQKRYVTDAGTQLTF